MHGLEIPVIRINFLIKIVNLCEHMVSAYIYTSSDTHTHSHTHTHTQTHTHTHTHTRIFTHLHTHLHVYTYTQRWRSKFNKERKKDDHSAKHPGLIFLIKYFLN